MGVMGSFYPLGVEIPGARSGSIEGRARLSRAVGLSVRSLKLWNRLADQGTMAGSPAGPSNP